MEISFSTSNVHPRDRFSCWHEIVCKTLLSHDAHPQNRLHFVAEVSATAIADLGLLKLRHSPMNTALTPAHIATATDDDLIVSQTLSGRMHIEQAGNETTLKPSEFCLLDPLLPNTAHFTDAAHMLHLKVPRRALEARIGKLHGIAAQPLALSGIGRLTAHYLTMLPEKADTLGEGGELVRNQAIDLIAMAVAQRQGRAQPASHMLVLLKLHAALQARLHDPSLTPAAVAEAAGISVRYANLVLRGENTSLGHLILSSRLERARKALQDPAQRHRTVTDIALGWGFSSPAHFSRAFARAFGAPPRAYRERTLVVAPS